jgi:trk system potassium uptake protein TrkH
MRNRFKFLGPVFAHLGSLFWVLGFLQIVPLLVLVIYTSVGRAEASPLCYLLPAALSLAIGWMLTHRGSDQKLGDKGALMVCALGWVCLSAVAALPFCIARNPGANYLDAYFETVSGFTTTGITMFTGLDAMPRSIIFWRAFLQWLGGLGILTFFLMVVGGGGASHRLFSAETHKIFSHRPAPGLFNTLKILWGIYSLYTVLIALLMVAAGTSLFDGIVHSFTCLSTGGYSPYDASIAHYRQAGYEHYIAIEYILTFGMILGGTNFFVHFRLCSGDYKSLWDNLEVRIWWVLLGGATVLIFLDHSIRAGFVDLEANFRASLFQVVSIATTTGFATKDIGNTDFFPGMSRQIFLILMLIGGCVGSTGGGIKVLRIGVLTKMIGRQIRRAVLGRRTTNLLMVNGEQIQIEEVRRIAALFFAWVFLLAVGGAVTAILTYLGPAEAASGMFSALGNIGPCYISVEQMTELHPLIKLTYIVGMLAGRLEILPILMLFSRWTWR